MDVTRLGSLARFVQKRAVNVLGGQSSAVGARVNLGVGAVSLLAGVGLGVAGVIGPHKELLVASIGPAIAGVVNLTLFAVFRRHALEGLNARWTMTREARTLFLHVQWTLQRAAAPIYGHWVWMQQTIPDSTLLLLERASHAYNRVSAATEVAVAGRLATRIVSAANGAADATMAEIFDLAAVLQKYPESAVSTVLKIDALIERMARLADDLEAEGAIGSPLDAPSKAASRIDDVLEDLRLERLARQELHPDAANQRHLDA